MHLSLLARVARVRPPAGCVLLALAAWQGCASDTPPSSSPVLAPAAAALGCDDALKTSFHPDASTQVVLVKAFPRGESLALPDTPALPAPPLAAADLCLVKLLVGPGNPGSAGAPSTSAGIGIEVWLPAPAAWNERIRNLGGGGWQGGDHASATRIGQVAAAAVAAGGYLVGTTDTGHTIPSGAFAMREDGGINRTLWTDFAERSLVELAKKTKALALAYYGKPQRFAYWDGCSTGGRQGYKMAQEHPEHYDGYVIEAPAINWTRFIMTEMYPQIVLQRDLGGNLGGAQLGLVSAAAVSACDSVGGQHLGFIPDPRRCAYDPTRDATVLCSGQVGHGVVGTSTSAACVSTVQAEAIDKIWFGQTADGTVPAADHIDVRELAAGHAGASDLAGHFGAWGRQRLWWGLSRGAFLGLLAGDAASPPFFGPFPIAPDMVALQLQDPRYATPAFVNATGSGANRWRDMTYADLAVAYGQGLALQPAFGRINTDNPHLSAVRDRGAKIVMLHGWGDQLIPPMGSIDYYTRVAAATGGFTEVQAFDRLFMVPALGHCGGIGSVPGLAGPALDANHVPLPAPNQFFDALVAWVETQAAPDRLVLRSADASVSLPVCPYPAQPVYAGTGAVTSEASYTCR